jgi:hypothetical protein
LVRRMPPANAQPGISEQLERRLLRAAGLPTATDDILSPWSEYSWVSNRLPTDTWTTPAAQRFATGPLTVGPTHRRQVMPCHFSSGEACPLRELPPTTDVRLRYSELKSRTFLSWLRAPLLFAMLVSYGVLPKCRGHARRIAGQQHRGACLRDSRVRRGCPGSNDMGKAHAHSSCECRSCPSSRRTCRPAAQERSGLVFRDGSHARRSPVRVCVGYLPSAVAAPYLSGPVFAL